MWPDAWVKLRNLKYFPPYFIWRAVQNVMKRQFSNNFCNHCWNFSVDILWCHFMGLLQINAAQLLPYIYKKKNSFLFFVGNKMSSYNQTPALWLVTITSQTDVWTLTNEWFSEGSFCFIGGGALEIWRNLSACLLISERFEPELWALMTSSILCLVVYSLQISNTRFTSLWPCWEDRSKPQVQSVFFCEINFCGLS